MKSTWNEIDELNTVLCGQSFGYFNFLMVRRRDKLIMFILYIQLPENTFLLQ